MNTVVTSKEAILKTCREIVSKEDLSAVSMRHVAGACHVALGSLYNYFPSKDDLIMETIESVWQDIFHMESCDNAKLPFEEYVRRIFESIHLSTQAYPNFLTAHSVSLTTTGRNKARGTMEHYLVHVRTGMEQSLKEDSRVGPNAFSALFTESEFIDFVLTSILTLLIQQKEDCRVLLEMICRTLYLR